MPPPQPRLDSNDLAAIVAIADHGSMRRAATTLGQTVAALSKHVRILEARLGITLFDRNAAGARPTAPGAALATAGRRILADIDAALDQVDDAYRPSGLVRIGAGPFIMPLMAREVNQPAHARWPDLMIEIQPGVPDDMLPRVRSGALDFALCHLEDQTVPAALEARPLQYHCPAIIARAGHPLAGLARIEAPALAGFSTAGSQPYRRSTAWYEAAIGARQRLEFISMDYSVIAEALQTSDMVSIVSKSLAAHMVAKHALVVLDVMLPPYVHILHLVGPAAGIASPAARRVAAMVTARLSVDERAA